MKKLIAAFYIFIAFTGWSQENKVPEDFSIVAGAGLSHVFGGDKLDPSFAYFFGIEKNVVQFGEKSFLNMGIVYSVQGAEYSEIIIENDGTQSGKITLGYIGVPILYRHRSAGGFFWEAGLQTGFLVRGKDHPDNGDKADYKEAVKTVDISIPAGIGYWVNRRFSIGARAVYGLTDMSGNGAKIPPANSNHQNFLIAAVLRFNITGK
ncbi:porin family protein [Maribellus sediminis]|uniref:porin family protein n=1 Tax=Maribellus sediminis TaxID=2696285 RepID=UPI001431463B|nr:porin family protein [Maribellus sediminis]